VRRALRDFKSKLDPQINAGFALPWIDIPTPFGRITGSQYGWFGW
jgi:hypothetical protein